MLGYLRHFYRLRTNRILHPSMLAKIFSRFAKVPETVAQAPEGRRFYAIGDIHGHLDLLDGLLAQIFADEQARSGPKGEIIFLGDLINRGPQSAQVIDRLIALKAQRPETRFLLGNHEELFLTALDGNREAIRFFDRVRGQSLTVDSVADSRLAFGGSLGRADWRYGRGMGADRAACCRLSMVVDAARHRITGAISKA
jgi:hypothetical protein